MSNIVEPEESWEDLEKIILEHFKNLKSNIKQVTLLLNDLQRQYRALTGKNYVIGG